MFGSSKSLLVVFALIVGVLAYGGWKFPAISDALNIANGPEISKKAQTHILHGDNNGGGHLHGTGKPCKTEFPKQWDEAEIISNVRAVAANDNLDWKRQKNGYYVATDKVDDVKVRVVLDKERDGVVTAYPINVESNACNTKAKTAKSAKAAKTVVKKKPVKTAARVVKNAPQEKEQGKIMPNASSRAPRTHNFNSR